MIVTTYNYCSYFDPAATTVLKRQSDLCERNQNTLLISKNEMGEDKTCARGPWTVLCYVLDFLFLKNGNSA